MGHYLPASVVPILSTKILELLAHAELKLRVILVS